ncbi:MAG: Calx-beta domain-containing protein [Nitrosomonas sp.]|nr:Calx-beta domain-containing protein [Nitrosomonas sp.]
MSVGNSYGTGVLLYDGRAVLTAAHLLQTVSGTTSSAVAHFETISGSQTIAASKIEVIPSYDSINSNNDLALIWLNTAAPVSGNRYEIYRNSDEIGQIMTLVGYGLPGSGASGIVQNYTGPYLRLKAQNRVDVDAGTFKASLGSLIAWNPTGGTQWIADFDNGLPQNDALGQLLGVTDLGLGADEGMITSGDSGGPAFINGQIAGIASYRTSLARGDVQPDVDINTNSSFGELGFWQRTSHYQQWIDQSLRSSYPNAPTKPTEVQKITAEGNSGTTYTYFLVQFNGLRTDSNAMLSVNYATRDGTAKAGEDYLAVNGKLVIYPDESQAVIPVEIVGDYLSEPDETFYLDIFNPVGGSFPDGAVTLTAVRTILNDDGWIG